MFCQTLFIPTRAWQVFCRPGCRKNAKMADRMVEHACQYCGLVSATVDHVPPRSVRQFMIDSGLASRYPFVEVRSCQECNSGLGDRPLWTVAQRKVYIKKWLARRYRKFLDIPEWSETELARLGEDLREHVLHGLAVKALIIMRLRY